MASVTRSRIAAAALLVALVAALAPDGARADGDPASDYLLYQDVFLPSDAGLSRSSATQLVAILQDAKKRGYPLRVALIGTRYDLGAVGGLWKRPQDYARFLGQELTLVYQGRLLIVMPNGYGIYHHGRSTKAEEAALAALPTAEAQHQDLATAAIPAAQRLAALAGLKLQPQPTPSGGSRTLDRIELVAIALTVAALAALVATIRRLRRRRSDEPESRGPEEGPA